MSSRAESSAPGRRRLGPAVGPWTAVAFLGAAAYLTRLQLLTPYLPENEGYYHARFARLLTSFGFDHEFSWTAHGIWAERFADLGFLYHALLAPFTWWGNLLVGVKLATVAFGAAVVASFHAVLWREGVRWPFVWTAMLFCGGPPFVCRLASPRPEALALLLFLWCVHASRSRSRLGLAALATAYTLSSALFYLPLVLAAAVALERLVARRKPDWNMPAAIAAGVGSGLLLHPQFPYNFQLLWLQNFAGGGSAALDAALGMHAPTARELLRAQAPAAWLAPIAVYLILGRPRPASSRTRGMLLLASAMLALAFAGAPVVEYSLPLTLFLCASFVTDQFPLSTAQAGPARGRAARIILVLAASFVLLLGWLTYREASARARSAPPLPEREARFLAEHTEPRELVFTCTAEEATELFFLDPGRRYLVVADPRWMYFEDPVRWRAWYELARGRLAGRTYDFLDPSVRYGFCGSGFDGLRRIIDKDPRMDVVLEGADTYVFHVDRRRGIGLDEFMELRPGP